uniref:Cuticle protein 6 n=1 Tax=Lygus hesperus TaxID=30085 RepID=A0A0A9VYF6_LYGHE
MKTIITILAAVGLASAGVIPVPVAPLVGHVATQYHAQDELGQYSYGYAGGPSAKEEIKTADGITRGGYSYVDGNGLVQSAAYVSDPVNGFRVAATNLPAGPAVPATPEVLAPVAVFPSAPVVPLLPSSLAAAVRDSSVPLATPVESAVPLSSTVIQSAVSPITVQQELPAPVSETTAEEKPETSEVSSSNENPAAEENQSTPQTETAPEPQAVPATIEQLVTPIQDTPEVQAAKAAHLAAFEEVKLRDAAQEAEDAKNNISTGDSEKVNPGEGEESTESTTETTDAPSSEAAAAPVESALPALPAPHSPVYNSAPVDSALPALSAPAPVVATQLVPAASPEVAPVVPSILTKAVVVEQVAPGPVVAQVATSPAVAATPAVVAPVASTVLLGAPVAASPSGPVALEHVGQITSQYHAQDELGQYTFGYSGGPSAKHEVKTADGLTSGGYSYIDSHGLVQSAAYVSDPVNGFRVAATNIPKPREPEYISDSPEVEEAKQKLFQAQAEHIAKL